MSRSWPSWIAGPFRALIWGAGVYAGLCFLAFLVQRRMMYFPDRCGEQEARQQAADLGLIPWQDSKGSLLGWRRSVIKTGVPRVLILHGNAGEALSRTVYLPMLEAAGFEGVLLEYPGYGPRGGLRSQASLVAEARSALRCLRAESTATVILLGESLGSGVAMLIAGRDEVVGAAQGHRLAQGCAGPVRVWEVPGAAHNELPLAPNRPPWPEALTFLREQARMGQ